MLYNSGSPTWRSVITWRGRGGGRGGGEEREAQEEEDFYIIKVKAFACKAGDPGSIPGSGTSPGEGNGNPLQYSCLENSTD